MTTETGGPETTGGQAPFRPRTREELSCLERALDGLAVDAVAEIEDIGGNLIDPLAILAAVAELRAVADLLDDLRAHAAACRKKPATAKKKVGGGKKKPAAAGTRAAA